MAEVQRIRPTTNGRRVEQALLDIDRAVAVLQSMHGAAPEAFNETRLETDEGDPIAAFNAVGYLADCLTTLQNQMAEHYRATTITKLEER